MAKYLLKSKILATLNETLNKIKLSEAGATVTPPEMDSDGNFVSSVETNKKPAARGVDIEQDKKLNNSELLQKAREKIRNSEDLINDLEGIISQISGKTISNEWEVNEDHNDVYLPSRDAHIFQQNDSICLSHLGKIEIFKTVQELHDWLKKNGWPLPPAVEIHESTEKDVLQEVAKGTVTKAWNALVDLANGQRTLVVDHGKRYLVTRDGKNKYEVTQIVEKELAKAQKDPSYLQHFRNKAKFTGKGSEYQNNNDLATKVTSGDQSFDNSWTMQDWVRSHITDNTMVSLNKRDDFTQAKNTTLVSLINNASNGTPGQKVYGDKVYNFTPENFERDLDTLLVRAVQKNSTRASILERLLNDIDTPLNPKYVDFVKSRYDYYKTRDDDLNAYNTSESSEDLDHKIQGLLESSKRFPWLNQVINQHLIKEDDTLAGATADFDNSVAAAGGMDTSSSTSTTDTTTDTNNNSDVDSQILGDLDNTPPDLGGSSSGGINMNFGDMGGADGDAAPVPPQDTYTIVGMKFPKKDANSQYDSSEIVLTLQNTETNQIVHKPLNGIDTL